VSHGYYVYQSEDFLKDFPVNSRFWIKPLCTTYLRFFALFAKSN
jgi:hypothetical protein